jgi:Holliday junction DNA helicase RuvA
VFLILLAISGIGPRIALAILSTIPVNALIQIVLEQRVDSLKRVPGIGQRTAEKMLVELKGKLDHLWLQGAVPGSENTLFLTKSHTTSQTLHDVESALCNLGFKTADFQQTLSDLAAKLEKPDFQDLLRKVLLSLNQRNKPQAHKANLDAVF